MARRVRIEYPGALYHVLDRGDRREAIYGGDADRELFLRTLGEACGRTGWRVHAFVLMSNHYHLMLETPEANLVKGMHWLQCTYTARYNRRHGVAGHLFQGRYKALVVEAGGYLAALSDYIHLNPVRAGMVDPAGGGRLAEYRWSSYPAYVGWRCPARPPWLETASVLGELGWTDSAGDRRAYSERMQRRAREQGGDAAEPADFQRGWCLGGDGFRKRMLALLDAASDGWIAGRGDGRGEARGEHSEHFAQSLLIAGLHALGLSAAELSHLPKNDARKRALGVYLRRHTIVSNSWLAAHLHLGHASRASRYCSRLSTLGSDAAEFAALVAKLKSMATCTT